MFYKLDITCAGVYCRIIEGTIETSCRQVTQQLTVGRKSTVDGRVTRMLICFGWYAAS
jgi:hypothetical protein